MHTGRVMWFNDSKGFGLIESEGGQTAFVHYSSIVTQSTSLSKEAFRTLKQGQRVEFELYEDDIKGYLARNVVVGNT